MHVVQNPIGSKDRRTGQREEAKKGAAGGRVGGRGGGEELVKCDLIL